ncbi:MAG TPA: 2Fe-2S iron-sulfur cluster-binding protein [Acidocella sp.]|jgi:2Fe-2S ferredoxin|uniref:2Fe-2S iron-sulfur cluster-binding protein n=1 Tax=Acidocella sp. TaxID=50710 RepID=UPI002CAE87A8|nr:2Fe-2S iron-sulfur cluster-binding protein [Acidocella sp.]HVE21178.1 2Fe-2S iron-sulfur cluster-binding protein [Acidocella sp.]
MPTLFITDLAGVEHRLEGAADDDLMHIVRDAGLPLRGECNGSLACATCHLIIDPVWFEKLTPPDADELDILDYLATVTPTSRLGCQVHLTAELDGLRAAVAEPD